MAERDVVHGVRKTSENCEIEEGDDCTLCCNESEKLLFVKSEVLEYQMARGKTWII